MSETPHEGPARRAGISRVPDVPTDETPGGASGGPIAVASWLRTVGEIAVLGLLYFFVRSPGTVNPQHRIMFVLFGVSLAAGAWVVWMRRAAAPGWRLWLMAAGGFVLSLAVKGESLTRPPSLPAAYCAMAAGAAGILSILAIRRYFRPSGVEGGIIAGVIVIAGAMALLFRSVASQNSLDDEVLHNTLGLLLDYTLLLFGLSALSRERGSFTRVAVLMSIACLVKLVWRHAVPAG